MYSFGVLLWEIASRDDPLKKIGDYTTDVMINHIANNNYRDPIPVDTPEPFANMIRRCQSADPQERPTAKQAADELDSAGEKLHYSPLPLVVCQ
eukprot:TRINITY_DN10069_c0_g1_i1.p1 TRINITY_DN10069_c0_g1~~TRINITY_DN10069_c0_g1_i1.p1  ORF type:complete len:110 (+),score=22.25 TRINITY_DN10069_c0_g1_i1:49-330(+)